MFKKVSAVQWLAWFYCAYFFFIVALSHWPGLTDRQGRLMGLYTIDPIDDIFHLLSGLGAGIAAYHSAKWSINYFKWAGIPYLIDAITGCFFSTEFLNGEWCRSGFGSSDLSLPNVLRNGPHIL